MSETKIEWCDYTFNPWWGCARVSPGCVNCYADTLASRWGHELWRRHGPRKSMSETYWRQPLRWNRRGPARVFCASMADVFEDHPEFEVRAMQDAARSRLWNLIAETPNLTWLLLTKRPENTAEMVTWGERWPGNVWVGTSVEDQRRADERLPILLRLPAVVRFVSAEPLLAPVGLAGYLGADAVSWLIVGGESGGGARPMRDEWARSLIEQCRAAGAAPFVKQLGSAWARRNGAGGKGDLLEQWPAELRVREFPAGTGAHHPTFLGEMA